MKKQFILIISLFLYVFSYSQKSLDSDFLYADQSPIQLKLNYSNKNMKKNTTDSTFIKTDLNYFYKDKWNTIPVSLRARGNFRRAKCYFPPIKMKIKKSQNKNTIFNGNKSLKLVLPCKTEDEKNDNILKEFVAYKIYELILNLPNQKEKKLKLFH